MDYPNNEYKQKNRPFFDDEALEREFSDPQLALDYDGEIVFYDEDVPPKQIPGAAQGGKPPKKKKGVVFLIIACVLLVCSAVFAVLMFMRMMTNADEGEAETASPTAVTEAVTTEPASTAETTEAVTAREPKETIPPRVTDPAVTAPTGIIDSTIGVGTVPAESQPITFGITR